MPFLLNSFAFGGPTPWAVVSATGVTQAAGSLWNNVLPTNWTPHTITCDAGDTLVLLLSARDLPTTQAVVGASVPSGESASWTLVARDGNAHSEHYILVITTTVAWVGHPTVLTRDNGTTNTRARLATLLRCTGGSSSTTETPIKDGAGNVTGPGTVTQAFTGGAQPPGDCLVVGVSTTQANATITGDADTTNGSWVTDTDATTGTNFNNDHRAVVQHKITTAAGDQSWDTSIAIGSGWVIAATAIALVT